MLLIQTHRFLLDEVPGVQSENGEFKDFRPDTIPNLSEGNPVMADRNKTHDRATHHYNLGIKFERENDNEKAQEEFLQSIKNDPCFPYPHKSLAEIYIKDKRFKEALACCRKALELDPGWIEAKGLLAEVYFALGDIKKAIENMKIALEGDTENTHYISLLGRMHIASEQYAEAIELLESALKRGENSYFFHYHLGIAYGKRAQNDLDLSIEHWRSARKLYPDEPKIYRNMAIALFSRGLMREAVGAFRRALELDPDDEVAAKFIKFSEIAAQNE